jgi:carbonic anhydrase
MALPHGSQPLLDRFHRRRLLKASGAITALAFLGAGTISGISYADALTKAQRERLTPDDILALMKKGNKRFCTGKREDRNFLAQQRASARGQ